MVTLLWSVITPLATSSWRLSCPLPPYPLPNVALEGHLKFRQNAKSGRAHGFLLSLHWAPESSAATAETRSPTHRPQPTWQSPCGLFLTLWDLAP